MARATDIQVRVTTCQPSYALRTLFWAVAFPTAVAWVLGMVLASKLMLGVLLPGHEEAEASVSPAVHEVLTKRGELL